MRKQDLLAVVITYSVFFLAFLALIWIDIESDPPMPDGFMFLFLDGNLVKEVHLGHNEVMDFCRADANDECKDSFYGCGAVNCRCNFSSKDGNFEVFSELFFLQKEESSRERGKK